MKNIKDYKTIDKNVKEIKIEDRLQYKLLYLQRRVFKNSKVKEFKKKSFYF